MDDNEPTPKGALASAPATGTALAVRRHTDLDALAELGTILTTGEMETEVMDDPEAISRQIVEELLAAESDEELEMGNAQGWAGLEGVPVEVHGFRWRPSEYDQGSKVYFIVWATDMRDGENLILTTGSKNVIAALINLARRDRLPAVRVLARSEKPSKNGYYPQWLVSTPETVAARKAERVAARNAEVEA